VCRIRTSRAVAIRTGKRTDNFLAGIEFASARIWMRFNEIDDLDRCFIRGYTQQTGSLLALFE